MCFQFGIREVNTGLIEWFGKWSLFYFLDNFLKNSCKFLNDWWNAPVKPFGPGLLSLWEVFWLLIQSLVLGRFRFSISFFFNFIYLFYLWLCWVFISVRGPSPVAASGGHPSSRCAGLSLSWPLLLRSTGSGSAGSVIVAHGPSWSVACGIFPDQGSNLCPLHWQADSQPLRHQGSPKIFYFF